MSLKASKFPQGAPFTQNIMSPGVEPPRSRSNPLPVRWWALWRQRPYVFLIGSAALNQCLDIERRLSTDTGGIARSGQNTVVTSIATAMSGQHSSQVLRSCSTFRRTWGRILRSRFSPNFCSFSRIFWAGRKFFRSSGSLDSSWKYLQFPIPRREGQLGSCWGVGLGISGSPSLLSFYHWCDVSQGSLILIWENYLHSWM